MDILMFLMSILCGLWLADFGSGFVHWVVDKYASPTLPIVGPRHVVFSHAHHFRPMELFELAPHERHGGIVLAVAMTGGALALVGWLNTVTVSALVFGALTNVIHGWSHRTAQENGPLLTGLHRIGLFQSPIHHIHHHSGQNDTHYCLLTDHVNPVLEAVRLWPRLEAVLAVFGLRTHWWLAKSTARAKS